MKLFYYDKFLESYAKLPKQIQKKVQDFVQKFRNDSTMHSIHLEPINTFKDPQLRTARIDQKYRAIIYASPAGDIFHLLWVDNHDEAMQWASNKVFEWNKNTQAYQVYESVENTVLPETSKQSAYCEKFSDEDLLSIGIPYPLLPSVKKINDLNDLEALEAYLPREAFENLYYLLDGIGISDIIKEIEEGKVESAKLEEQITSPNNLRSFFEVKDDSDVEEFLNGDLSKWKIFLHPTQRKLSEINNNGSFKVTGAAGTGKTVLALHRLKYLSNLTKKNKSILFTTFTKSLIVNLKDLIHSLDINIDKVVISNIHSFIIEKAKTEKLIEEDSKIIDFFNRDKKEEIWREVIESKLSEFDSEFLMKEYEEVILFNNIQTREEYLHIPRVGLETPLGRKDRIKVWEIIEHFNKVKNNSKIYYLDEVTNKLTAHFMNQNEKPFQNIIADEIQDFSDVELRLLRSMVSEKGNDLFLVGDPLQKIYKRNINFSRAGINIRGTRSRRLKINYRTTEEIKLSAISVIKEIPFANFDGEEENKSGYISILHGEKPKHELYASSEEMNNSLLKYLHELIENDNIKLNEVCIAARTKSSKDDAKKIIHNQKLPYYDLTTEAGNKQGIQLSTFHNMKGLEFKVVILYDVSDNTVPYKFYGFESLPEFEKKSYLKSERALLYVAMTRAIKELYIFGTGNKSKIFEF